jgi:isoquinoline 1-oxidoreductase beta subunit
MKLIRVLAVLEEELRTVENTMGRPVSRLNDGKVEQTNFDGYQVLRIDEMPKVEVHIVQSPEAPTGVGEPGVAPIGAAVANAVFAATAKRLRILPFSVGGTA